MRILVDNLFNPRMYPSVTLSSNENSDNTSLIAASRRSVHDAWSPTTLNVDAWNKARHGEVHAADMMILDRRHNLGTETVKGQVSDDDYASPAQDFINVSIPANSGMGALTDALGVVTHEGAWMKRLTTPRTGHDWRTYYVAMGASLKPIVTGLWMGLSWSPGDPWRPHSPGMSDLIVEETQSDRGWIGRSVGTPRRQGMLRFKFVSLFDAEQGAWHLDQIARGRPFWIIPDEDRAEESFLAVLPKGTVGTVLEPGYFYPSLDLPYVELAPSIGGD